MLLRIRPWVIFFTLLGPAVGSAEEITFDELERAALASSPAAAAVSSRIAAKRAKGVAATAPGNPELGVEVRPFLGSHGDRKVEYEIELSQPFRLWGVSERQEYARLVEEHATLEERLSLFELTQKLKLLYGRTWALQKRETQLEAHLAKLRSLDKLLGTLAERGAAASSTVHLVKAETGRLRGALIGLGADRKRAVAELVRATAVPLGERDLAPLPPAALDAANAVSDFPVVERARLAAKISVRRNEIARLDAYPELSPRAAFEHTSDGDDRLNLGVQIELPLFSRNEAERLESLAEKTDEQTQEKYFTGEAFREEERLLRDSVRAAAEEHTLYETKVLPELEAGLKAALSEFEAGQASPAHVWQTLLALSEAQEHSLELETKALSERVELSILLGTDI